MNPSKCSTIYISDSLKEQKKMLDDAWQEVFGKDEDSDIEENLLDKDTETKNDIEIH